MFHRPEIKWSGTSFNTVQERELGIVNAQRANRCQPPAGEVSQCAGIAISGGGIRSASFGLGVLQALEYADLLRRFDYLSTVSGGGYIGSALTWFNYQHRKRRAAQHATPSASSRTTTAAAAQPAEAEQAVEPVVSEAIGTDSGDAAASEIGDAAAGEREGCDSWWFPFCMDKRYDFAATGISEALQAHYKRLYTELDYIREHGNYLVPSKHLTSIALFGVLLRNSVTSAFVYLGVLVMLLWTANVLLQPFDPVALPWLGETLGAWRLSPVLWLSLAGFGVMTVLTLLIAVTTRVKTATASAGYNQRIGFQIVFGWVLLVTLLLAVLGTLPLVTAVRFDHAYLSNAAAVLPAVLGSAGAIYQFFWQKANAGAGGGMLSGLRIWITASLLIYGVLLLAYLAQGGLPTWGVWLWFAVSVTLGLCINTNLFGIGRMYRDRLMETFLPDREAVSKSRWRPAHEADVTPLTALCGEQDTGPYHLINAHVVLTDSRVSRYRNRGGDNFVMSHAYCGGDAIGWYPSSSFEGGEMSLATAMSISGAAVNPRAGVGGHGVTRNRLVSFMLAFFNIRLGFWADNPRVGRDPSLGIGQPNFFCPGLLQGLFGRAMHREANYLELTDGGHFDNTGLYELVRRRLSLIILSQAGEDPGFAIDDLANAIERVRADFGVVMLFTDKDLSLRNMVPGTGDDSGFSKQMDLSNKGYAIAQIQYPPERPGGRRHYGTLVILKTVLTEGLPPEIYSYKCTNQDFPHQSTADQFFAQEQLEAYRELGYNLCYNMLHDATEVHQLLGK